MPHLPCTIGRGKGCHTEENQGQGNDGPGFAEEGNGRTRMAELWTWGPVQFNRKCPEWICTIFEWASYPNVYPTRMCVLCKCAFYLNVLSIWMCFLSERTSYLNMYDKIVHMYNVFVHCIYILCTWYWYITFGQLCVFTRNVHYAYFLYDKVLEERVKTRMSS